MNTQETRFDHEAISQAVTRVMRRRRQWTRKRALAECARVADKHGCDGAASAAEANKRLNSLASLREGFAEKAAKDRATILAVHPRLNAYRVVSAVRKSRVFYCRSDERAVEMSAWVRCPRVGTVQVVRLEPDGSSHFVAVV